MTNVTASFQVATAIVFAAALLVAAGGFRRWPEWRGAFLPAGLVAGAGVAFYWFVLVQRPSTDQVLLWGAAHRFLTAMLIFGGVATFYWMLGDRHDGR